ncbi:MAG TPA: GNAT family N-acetyltransferase [Bacteroidia bacterium]|nr:GNAT family N-acetyltransferase [Bacteroidia bacterium]HNT79195.1 GNAT family N-acetyltransferase [Bacteroidia bacterium]
MARVTLKHQTLSKSNWKDFTQLFGPNGACGNCWCTYWRVPKMVHEAGKSGGNKRYMQSLTTQEKQVGLLFYADDKPIAWCSIAPREEFSQLKRSKLFKAIDDKKVWSITCLFMHKDIRKKNMSTRIIRAAASYALKKGAEAVESYPVNPKDKTADVFLWTGIQSTYEKAGFEIVKQVSETRSIMRKA